MIYGNNTNTKNNLPIEETIKILKESASKFIDQIKDGERQIMVDLIDKVSADTGLRFSVVNGILPSIIRGMPGLTVKTGAGGGIWKGEIKERVDNRQRCPTCFQVGVSDKAKEVITTYHKEHQIIENQIDCADINNVEES